MYDDEPTMMGQGRPTATLVIRQGAQAGMSFPILGNQVIIGREEGLDIVLQDPEASRRHARISWQGEQYTIEDLGSTNGTFVNGIQITAPQMLRLGDSIGIGQTAIVFQSAGGPVAEVVPQGGPQQVPAYGSLAGTGEAESKTTQYLLYGCGCLLLLCICVLLAVVVWVSLDPNAINFIENLSI